MTLQFQLAAMTILSMVQTLLQILNGACLMTIIWGVREGDGRRKNSRNPREIEKYITNKVEDICNLREKPVRKWVKLVLHTQLDNLEEKTFLPLYLLA